MEKFDYRLRKAEFLCKCDDSNVIPNFLNFRLANSHIKNSSTYRLRQLNPLREEIRQKKFTLRRLKKEFSSLKVSFYKMSLIWLILLTSALFSSELMTRFSNQEVQFIRKSFINFYKKARLKTITKKVIFDFSKNVLSNIEKKLFAKGLNFCLSPKQLKYADYLVHFELFNRDIRNLEILSNEDLDFEKTKAKEITLLSFGQYNKNPQ